MYKNQRFRPPNNKSKPPSEGNLVFGIGLKRNRKGAIPVLTGALPLDESQALGQRYFGIALPFFLLDGYQGKRPLGAAIILRPGVGVCLEVQLLARGHQ